MAELFIAIFCSYSDTPIAWSSDPYWAPDGLCVAFSVLNKWLLRNCSTVLPFLCQARPGDREYTCIIVYIKLVLISVHLRIIL